MAPRRKAVPMSLQAFQQDSSYGPAVPVSGMDFPTHASGLDESRGRGRYGEDRWRGEGGDDRGMRGGRRDRDEEYNPEIEESSDWRSNNRPAAAGAPSRMGAGRDGGREGDRDGGAFGRRLQTSEDVEFSRDNMVPRAGMGSSRSGGGGGGAGGGGMTGGFGSGRPGPRAFGGGGDDDDDAFNWRRGGGSAATQSSSFVTARQSSSFPSAPPSGEVVDDRPAHLKNRFRKAGAEQATTTTTQASVTRPNVTQQASVESTFTGRSNVSGHPAGAPARSGAPSTTTSASSFPEPATVTLNTSSQSNSVSFSSVVSSAATAAGPTNAWRGSGGESAKAVESEPSAEVLGVKQLKPMKLGQLRQSSEAAGQGAAGAAPKQTSKPGSYQPPQKRGVPSAGAAVAQRTPPFRGVAPNLPSGASAETSLPPSEGPAAPAVKDEDTVKQRYKEEKSKREKQKREEELLRQKQRQEEEERQQAALAKSMTGDPQRMVKLTDMLMEGLRAAAAKNSADALLTQVKSELTTEDCESLIPSIVASRSLLVFCQERLAPLCLPESTDGKASSSDSEKMAIVNAAVRLMKPTLEYLFKSSNIRRHKLQFLKETQTVGEAIGFPRLSRSLAFIEAIWDALYMNDVVQEPYFELWYQDTDDQTPGRDRLLYQIMPWFEWLHSAVAEGEAEPDDWNADEEDDDDEDEEIDSHVPKRTTFVFKR